MQPYKFTIRKRQTKKSSKSWIWEVLGHHLGWLGGGFGRDLPSLGTSWVVLGVLFFMIVFGTVFKIVLGRFWVDFGSNLGGLG